MVKKCFKGLDVMPYLNDVNFSIKVRGLSINMAFDYFGSTKKINLLSFFD